MHWVVNMAKRIGFKNLFFWEGGEKLGLTEKEQTFLEEAYAPHIRFVNDRFENIALGAE
jgi:hypothetical protein